MPQAAGEYALEPGGVPAKDGADPARPVWVRPDGPGLAGPGRSQVDDDGRSLDEVSLCAVAAGAAAGGVDEGGAARAGGAVRRVHVPADDEAGGDAPNLRQQRRAAAACGARGARAVLGRRPLRLSAAYLQPHCCSGKAKLFHRVASCSPLPLPLPPPLPLPTRAKRVTPPLHISVSRWVRGAVGENRLLSTMPLHGPWLTRMSIPGGMRA